MNITDGGIAVVAYHTLDGLADDCGTKMSHMKRLCNVRSAVVQNDRLAVFRKGHAEFITACHLLQIVPQILFLHIQVDESGLYNGYVLEYRRLLQLGCHVLCDHKRCLVILLSPRHSAVALILGKVRARRYADPSHGSIVACCRKGLPHLFG